MNVYRVVNEDTSGNPVYVDKNEIIYNSIYNFREGIPTNKKFRTSSKCESRERKRNVTHTNY